METSAFLIFGLPAAIAIIMLGLGLSLTVADFTRVSRYKRAVVIALSCQLVVLPSAAFGLVLVFGVNQALAVGMMLLAAAPGGPTANILSHLFGGDVALNITLTAINSVIAVISFPVVANLAIWYFEPGDGQVGLQVVKVVQVIAMVLIPVAAGMWVRSMRPGFAERMGKPVRIASTVLIVAVLVGAILAELPRIGGHLASVGALAVIFCVLSLAVGYLIPRLFGVGLSQSLASSMEIGVHNSSIAITVAVSALGSTEMALPAAVYGGIVLPLAATAAALIRVHGQRAPASATRSVGTSSA